jgi:UDP-3-O-acyl-N-acetylglucosamine deacetylase
MSATMHTLSAPISLSGPTLLSATPVTLTIGPSMLPGPGIWLARRDHPELPPVRASVAALVKGSDIRTTSLIVGMKNDKPVLVHTVEHVLSALAGLNVVSALVTVSGDAVPILDGSAGPIVDALAPVLVPAESHTLEPLIVTSRLVVRDDRDPTSVIEVLPRSAPGSSYRYEFHIVRPGGMTITQNAHWEGGRDQSAARYAKGVAPARTFSFSGEAEFFRIRGMFAHFTPRDLLVIDDATGGAVENEIRFENELARHKLLDLIGDLALVGRPIQAEIVARKAGHGLNQEMARRLVEQVESVQRRGAETQRSIGDGEGSDGVTEGRTHHKE